jgi:hypothetical protein
MTFPSSPRSRGNSAFPPLLFLLLPLLFLPALFYAAPVHGQGLQYITAPEVKNMMENTPGTVVINALSGIEYDGLHITGSINIPVIELRDSKLLPADPTAPLIFYCMGPD